MQLSGSGSTSGEAAMAYPLDANSYRILHEIGSGVSAVVYKAACPPMSSAVVAIKSIDLERSRANLEDVRREAKAMALLSHPNVLQAHCSFTVDRHLWVVMPFMAAGSLQSIVSSSFPDGLPEPSIAVVLKEVLRALSYLHGQGHIHRDIKAGNILLNSDGSVKLADFGVSASIYESNLSSSASLYMSSSSSSFFNDMAGTPYWMAPEVIHSHMGYGIKADIWSFGVTALELAHGRPPLSHLPLSKSLLMKITNRLGLDESLSHGKENRKGAGTGKKKKFSKAFKDMVDACLTQDPSKRPSADKLLKHPFFKSCKTTDYLVKNMLQAVPTLEERFKERMPMAESVNDADADGMVDGAFSPVAKNRRLSGWIFDEDKVEVIPVYPEESNDKCTVWPNMYDGEEIVDRACNPDAAAAAVFPTEFNGHEVEKVANHGRKNREEKARDVEDDGDDKYEDKQEVEVDDAACQAQGAPAATSVLKQFLVPNLVSLLNSLDLQRGVVMDVLTRCGCGGVLQDREEEHMTKQQQLWGYLLSVQQTVNDLNLQLQGEMKRNAQLQEEVEQLKKKMEGEGREVIKTAN